MGAIFNSLSAQSSCAGVFTLATTSIATGQSYNVGPIGFIFTAGSVTANLPTPAGISGRQYVFKTLSAGNTTISATVGTIDQATTQIIQFPLISITVVSDNSNWWII